MNIPWLTTVLGAIGDGKIADLLRTHVELMAAQRDFAFTQRDDAQAKVSSLQSEVQSLKAQLGDKTKEAEDFRTALNKLNDFHKNDGPKITYNTVDESGDTLQ